MSRGAHGLKQTWRVLSQAHSHSQAHSQLHGTNTLSALIVSRGGCPPGSFPLSLPQVQPSHNLLGSSLRLLSVPSSSSATILSSATSTSVGLHTPFLSTIQHRLRLKEHRAHADDAHLHSASTELAMEKGSSSPSSEGMQQEASHAENADTKPSADGGEATEDEPVQPGGAETAEGEVEEKGAEAEAPPTQKEKEIAELKDLLLRSYAEMENLRQRTWRENDATKKFAVQEFAKSLLDVADNLGRAVHAASPAPSSEANASKAERSFKSLLDGVVMTEKQLLQVLKKHGVERDDPLGKPFDPNLHSAMFEIADPSKESGTIAHVMKVGYTLHDRVIRPAEVGVVKNTEPVH